MSTSSLFICKNREHSYSGEYNYGDFSSGLFNSATYVSEMLNKNGVPSKVIHVFDNNGISKEVTKYNPTHVFIEALWVVPAKFDILAKLHPTVTWVIRVHSEVPFIANEGIAMEWLFDYLEKDNVYVAFNSHRIYDDFLRLVDNGFQREKILYLPNYYSGERVDGGETSRFEVRSDALDIGCFGAIRPLKNQLIQAIAAIEFADSLGVKMRFHINGTRVEQKGDPAIRNIRQLFANNQNHELVEHSWMPHNDFVNLISTMDINMQVSLTETFNIVTADAVVNGVPVVVSDEINWVCKIFRANPNSTRSIRIRLLIAYFMGVFGLHFFNEWGLKRYNRKSKRLWMDYMFDKE